MDILAHTHALVVGEHLPIFRLGCTSKSSLSTFSPAIRGITSFPRFCLRIDYAFPLANLCVGEWIEDTRLTNHSTI